MMEEASLPPLVDVVVKRSQWLRGEGGWNSKLLRSRDNKMCCMGFACRALGYSDEDIRDVKVVGQLTPARIEENSRVELLYRTNDIVSLSADERERRLITAGVDVGFNFTFID